MIAARDFLTDHREVLPAMLGTPVGQAAARDVRSLGAIAFRRSDDGAAYRVVPGGEVLRIEPGDDAPILVELDQQAWSDFGNEMATAVGLFYAGRMVGGIASPAIHAPMLRGSGWFMRSIQ